MSHTCTPTHTHISTRMNSSTPHIASDSCIVVCLHCWIWKCLASYEAKKKKKRKGGKAKGGRGKARKETKEKKEKRMRKEQDKLDKEKVKEEQRLVKERFNKGKKAQWGYVCLIVFIRQCDMHAAETLHWYGV